MAYILLVDDDKDMAEEMAEVLKGEGHEVEFRLDTDSGLAAIDERLPDLLVLDIMFPESDSAGFSFAQQLAEKFKGKGKLPILMVSSINEYFKPGFSANDIDDEWMPVSDFMEKPINFKVLKEKVKGLLARTS
jgi:DNA-binding response OmpR family regulator